MKTSSNNRLRWLATSIVALLAVLFSSTQCVARCATTSCHLNKSGASKTLPCHEHHPNSNETQPIKRICDFNSFLVVSEAAPASEFQNAFTHIVFFGPTVRLEGLPLDTFRFVLPPGEPVFRESNGSFLILRV